MKPIYFVHFVDGFNTRSIDICENISKAKERRDHILNGPLGELNHFVPIEVVSDEDRYLKLVLDDIETQMLNASWYLGGLDDKLCDWVENFIQFKQPGWEVLSKWAENESVTNQCYQCRKSCITCPVYISSHYLSLNAKEQSYYEEDLNPF